MMPTNNTFLFLDHDAELTINKKDLLIVQDGKIKVAEPAQPTLQPQYDSNGEIIRTTGTWTKEEHERFLKAMEMYPKGPWKAIAGVVGTRTVRQTQTHAQKYREKIARRMRGLRNRNGTLQQPPIAPQSSSFQPLSTYSVSSHRVAPIPQAARMHHEPECLPSMSYAALSQHSTQVASPTTPGRRSTHGHDITYDHGGRTCACSYGHCYSTTPLVTSTSPDSVAVPLPSVPMTASMRQSTNSTHTPTPNFDEFMDFFVRMYSHNPEQLAPRREFY